jgi:peptidoglycan/LPS O-acetylase OafA/YrhL/O-antigen ligase
LTTVVLGALWALWPLVALAGGLAYSTLSGLAALILLPWIAKSLRPRIYFGVLLAFFVFVGISSIWSPREQELIHLDFDRMQFAIRSEMLRVGLQILAQGALIAAALTLDEAGKQRVQRIAHVALILQLVMLVVLTVFEQQILGLLRAFVPDTGEGVQNISRNSLIMAAAAPLLAIGLMNGRPLAVGGALAALVIFLAAVVLAARGVNAGLLAMAAAGVAVLLVRLAPRHGFKILALVLAALVMTAPLTFGLLSQGADFATADDSSSYRAAIWQRVIALINEDPLTGGGLGSLRTVRETIETGMFAGQLTVPNHAHNMMLQLWAETGAIGASLLSAAIALAGWRMPDARGLGAGGLRGAAVVGAMAAVGGVSFDLWNEWWWAVGGILAMLAIATPTRVAPSTKVVEGAGLTFGGAKTRAPAELDAAPPLVAPLPAAHTANNFNLLRLLFALMVVVYHAIVLPGIAGWPGMEGWASVGAEIGVQGFFVLSGYLVWASLERADSLALYAEKRARRLLPGYLAVILATVVAALILIPAVRGDLSSVARYLGWNLAFLNFMEPNLPGVFEDNRFTEINGALWTLKIEVMFYLVLPLLALALRAAGTHRWILFAVIYAAAEAWRFGLEPMGGVWVELSRQLPGQMSFFITGIALCAWRGEINWRSMLVPLGVILFVLSILVPQAEPLRAAGLGILAVWLAVGIPKLFDAARFGDLSYGLYIVHFPIIQCIVAAGLFATSPELAIGLTAGACLAAALALWWFIERPGLRRDSAYRTNE